MHQIRALDDTVYFWFGSNNTSGGGADGASPICDVRLAGAAAGAAPVYEPTPILLTHANYMPGAHEVAIAATVANGFADGETYGVFCSLAVDGQNPTGFVGSFELNPIGNQVWDEILTGTTHNIATSAGRRLRELAGSVIVTGTGQAGSTSNTIVLDGTASAVNGAYDPAMISIIGGTGAGQTRLIYQYAGATKTAIVDRNWKVTPDATSEYIITGHPGREHVNEGLAQGSGGNNLITLNALGSSDNNAYVGQLIFIRSGTGEDQVRLITAYNGATKVATVEVDWDTNPDATSGYAILPNHIHSLADFFLTDSGTTYAAAVPGSVVKEAADNATATVNWAQAFSVDTGETYATAVAGSVVKETADNAGCVGSIAAQEVTYHVEAPVGTDIEGAQVWVSTDIAGTIVVWTGVTDAFGIARATADNSKPFLDPGTYYFWTQKTGYTFVNPDTVVVP